MASDAFVACRGTRWLVRSLYFPVFLQIRNLPSRSHDLKHTHTSSFPRRMFAPGFCIVASLTPNRGVGGAPRNVRVRAKHPLGLHITRQARRLTRRLASHDAGRSPLGAPPWRFWAPGAALASPAFAPDRLQRAPRTQVVMPGGRGPCLPRRAVTSRRRGTPLPAPPSGSSPETPLDERGCEAM